MVSVFAGGGILPAMAAIYWRHLGGAVLTPGGFLFTFGPAGMNSAVSATGQTLTVPAGLQANYQALTFLGAAVNGSQQPVQPFLWCIILKAPPRRSTKA